MKAVKKIIGIFFLIFLTGVIISVLSIQATFKKPQQETVKVFEPTELLLLDKTV
ncbi:hypothetical protein GCM10011416_08020 [Polaribacter pacificus]|uniref:Uncharacterized protein n=1 Tax=Polaribacter pacificus TaxID=1775173 RepID=A0A917HWS9_9FLAO|nr:hypothetical protein [Polaribacter pacificus]GGG93318.1 hypothetical protein GCM10011416_08020 [Polaribacter pacificus]